MLGTLYVNPYAILNCRNDAAMSSNADELDLGCFAHIRRPLLDVPRLDDIGQSVIWPPLVATNAVNIVADPRFEVASDTARPNPASMEAPVPD